MLITVQRCLCSQPTVKYLEMSMLTPLPSQAAGYQNPNTPRLSKMQKHSLHYAQEIDRTTPTI